MLDRRLFSLGALSTLAGCVALPRFAKDPFPLGVASGDPSSGGFVLWTRLIDDSLDERAVKVGWEVAEDEAFRRIVRKGQSLARKSFAHSVHVEVDELRPGRPYWYRFHAGDATSPVGRTLTFDPSLAAVRFALASCQNWEHGYFTAYRDILAQGAEFVLHVGDYIYERTWGAPPYVRPHGLPEARSLDDYRQRYALYRTEPSLQAAHATVPFICTWDDHEVSNDYAADVGVTGESPAEFARRRAAAYQAYFEHMPIRGKRIYRRVNVGDLMSLHVLDARQYRDPQACGSPEHRGGQRVKNCAAIHDANRTVLGRPQESWLYGNLRSERARWTVIAQQMLFANLELSSEPGEEVWSDFWDGYTANRLRLVEALAVPTVRNAVVLGGDIHSWWVSDLKADYARPESQVRGAEFITTCLASRNPPASQFGSAVRRNPHVRFMNNTASGYTLFTVDPRQWRADLRGVNSLADPHSTCRTIASFRVEEGRPGAERA